MFISSEKKAINEPSSNSDRVRYIHKNTLGIDINPSLFPHPRHVVSSRGEGALVLWLVTGLGKDNSELKIDMLP